MRPAFAIALAFLVAAAPAVTACSGAGRLDPPMPDGEPTLDELVVRVHGTWPHDTGAFTQGLLWSDGRLFESTGKYGPSDVRRCVLATGAVEASTPTPHDLFGEGLARHGDRLVQLTWRAETAFVYDAGTLVEVGRYTYAGQGWGLCVNDTHFVLSNGTDVLSLRALDTFEEVDRVRVTLRGEPLTGLNELEWANGWIYANVFPTDTIVRIDPATGAVRATIDASGLLTPGEAMAADVLNGIAWRPETETFLLTGKYWPTVFEVTFEPR